MAFSKHVYDDEGKMIYPVPKRYSTEVALQGVSATSTKVKYNFYPDQTLRGEDVRGSNIFPYKQEAMTKQTDGTPARRGKIGVQFACADFPNTHGMQARRVLNCCANLSVWRRVRVK
jgi:hypothetical protein